MALGRPFGSRLSRVRRVTQELIRLICRLALASPSLADAQDGYADTSPRTCVRGTFHSATH